MAARRHLDPVTLMMVFRPPARGKLQAAGKSTAPPPGLVATKRIERCMTEGGMAAAPNLPDFDLALERVQLQRRLSDVERRHERLEERLEAFPNEVTAKEERRVASELEAVNNRIDEIDATLIPFRLTR